MVRFRKLFRCRKHSRYQERTGWRWRRSDPYTLCGSWARTGRSQGLNLGRSPNPLTSDGAGQLHCAEGIRKPRRWKLGLARMTISPLPAGWRELALWQRRGVAEVPQVFHRHLGSVVLACGFSRCSFQTLEYRLSSCGTEA